MKLEKKILLLVWIVTSLFLIVFVPKNKIRQAHIVFLFKQVLTWLFGALVVEMNFIAYPYREFKKALRTSFTFEFFLYPAICVFFNLYYPATKSKIVQYGHNALFTSMITIAEVFMEKYTNLIEYVNWKWYWSWLSLFCTFYLSHKYFEWFFQESSGPEQDMQQAATQQPVTR